MYSRDVFFLCSTLSDYSDSSSMMPLNISSIGERVFYGDVSSAFPLMAFQVADL